MAKQTIRDLKPGDKVTLKFAGSKTYGNDPYEEQSVFKHLYVENGFEYAEFEEFTAYKADGYWRYGASAEILTVVKIHK